MTTNNPGLISLAGFRRQFTTWGFQPRRKRLSPEDEPAVLERIKELWEQNYLRKEIRQTLEDNGWEIGENQFVKLWKQNGFKLRNGTGYAEPDEGTRKRKTAPDNMGNNDDRSDRLDQTQRTNPKEDENLRQPPLQEPLLRPLEPQEAAIRSQRLLAIEQWDAQKMQSRKRRRRIRGFSHLPPDAPGTAPRYASETSLDECKAFLNMTNEIYIAIRNEYEAICLETNIIKKTQCADGVWDASKRRLISGNAHLNATMYPGHPDEEKMLNALDCICSDVTKRMRMASKTVTVAGASNLLGFNPTESKAVRRSLYEIMVADNFESRLLCGEDHWQSLRQRWISTSEKLQCAVDEGDPAKIRAVNCLTKDARKRLSEDRLRRGERTIALKNVGYGPGPGAVIASSRRRKGGISENVVEDQASTTTSQSPIRVEIREKRVREAVLNRGYPPQPSGNLCSTIANTTGDIDFNLDPALLIGGFPEHPPATAAVTVSNETRSIPAYFRLSDESTGVGRHSKMWLGKLASPTVDSLSAAALSKNQMLQLRKVHGVVKNADGTEDRWLIESQDELMAYLDEAGEKATFSVALDGAT